MAESHLSVTRGNNKIIFVCKTKEKKGRKANRKKKKVRKKSKLHWWTLGLKGGRRERERERDAPSDRQRDEAVILLDVTFENV